MRLVTFIRNEGYKIGVVIDGGYVVDLNAAHLEFVSHQRRSVDSVSPLASDMRSFLEQGETSLRLTNEIAAFAKEQLVSRKPLPSWLFPESDVALTAPILTPQKVVAIGQNYCDHCAEQGIEPPERPIIFAKFSTAIIGPGEPITWNPELTSQVDYEAELGVVIGKEAKEVSRENVFDHIAGYLNGNDVSARDLQFGDRQWVRGKSLDTFCPIGPYLVTKDEVPDPHNLRIRSILNGNVMQDSNTANLIFNVPFLVEFITKAFTLLPGDIILTGTPPGVGVFRKPQVLLKPGDTITIEVERLGRLTNPVVAWKK